MKSEGVLTEQPDKGKSGTAGFRQFLFYRVHSALFLMEEKRLVRVNQVGYNVLDFVFGEGETNA
mgnify:CR=1 FL=1